jgi:hypothetical protein
MTRKHFILMTGVAVIAFVLGAVSHSRSSAMAAPATGAAQRELQQLRDLVPDQAAVMTHVGYHFGNLWFAIQQQNWALADFYLGETRNNVKWAVRAKPVRKTAAGEMQLGAIAESVDNGPFTDLKKAIDAKQKERCVALYEQTLEACYACHKASEKPYLLPRRPDRPEVPIINFDPRATWPQ